MALISDRHRRARTIDRTPAADILRLMPSALELVEMIAPDPRAPTLERNIGAAVEVPGTMLLLLRRRLSYFRRKGF